MRLGGTRQLVIGLVVAVMGTMVWTGTGEAFWFYYKFRECRADLNECDADLAQCDAERAACEAAPICGNGVIEEGEDCDVGNLDGTSCEDLGFPPGGTPTCQAGCTFDTTSCAKTFFVTSQTFTGDLVSEAATLNPTDCTGLTGLDAGDCICQTIADGEIKVPSGTYRAWLADGFGSPNTRHNKYMLPYVNVNKAKIADNYNDLTDGSLDLEPDVFEDGTQVPASAARPVWTGTMANGESGAPHCLQWTSAFFLENGATGEATGADIFWSEASISGCSFHLALYCIEQ